ncbi:unnamed protein product, partial [Heterosigma akashiwo]
MMKFKIFFDLSSDKVEIMGFSRRVKTWFPNVHVIDYDNNHVTLPVKKETKLLGVWLDSRLTWHQELAAVAQKSLSTLFELKRIVKTTWGLSGEIVRELYEKVIRPSILVNVALWGPTYLSTKGHQNFLRKTDRLVALMITKAWPSADSFQTQNIAGIAPISTVVAERLVSIYTHTNFASCLSATNAQTQKRTKVVKNLLIECNLPHTDISFNPDFSALTSKGLTFYTDGSIIEGAAHGGGAVVEYHDGKEVQILQLKFPKHCNIFQIENVMLLHAIRMYKDRLRVDDQLSATIYSDALSVFEATHQLKPNRDIERISEEMRSLPRLKLVWIPSHCGINENERADHLAKLATKD